MWDCVLMRVGFLGGGRVRDGHPGGGGAGSERGSRTAEWVITIDQPQPLPAYGLAGGCGKTRSSVPTAFYGVDSCVFAANYRTVNYAWLLPFPLAFRRIQ